MKTLKIIILNAFLFALLGTMSCKKECTPMCNCNLEPDPGFCLAAFPKYYYDQEDNTCKIFSWGGCDGVVPFDSLEECESCLCNN